MTLLGSQEQVTDTTLRRASKLDALAQQSRAIFGFPADITDREAMDTKVFQTESVHRLSALAILNAGIHFIEELCIPGGQNLTTTFHMRTFW